MYCSLCGVNAHEVTKILIEYRGISLKSNNPRNICGGLVDRSRERVNDLGSLHLSDCGKVHDCSIHVLQLCYWNLLEFNVGSLNRLYTTFVPVERL